MISGARRLPVQHLSIRVPWHDAGWTSTVCNKPTSNMASRMLRRIADVKDDAAERAIASKSLAVGIEDSYKRQDELRAQMHEALGRFSWTFDYVVCDLLGDEVGARVDAFGRPLTLIVDHHGERESAAVSIFKLLAFDLAAITDSVEGRGCFPRFLIHDGPHEADMAEDIYERLFLYSREFEDCFSDEPGFQYIVTTTTQPPTKFLNEPWMRLRLAGTPAGERLMRMDL